MIISKDDTILTLSASTYTLTVPADRPFVYVSDAADRRVMELFVPSSVHALHGQDDTVSVGEWGVDVGPRGITLSISAASSIWDRKTYRFRCTPSRFVYDVEVVGTGRLTDVVYLGGYYSGHLRWGSGFFRSGHTFRRGFTPEPNAREVSHFSAAGSAGIDLGGVPLPGRERWFFTPPPFCFAFEHRAGWLGMGVEANAGAYRFTDYRYHGARDSFYLSLSYEGHTIVNGAYRLPGIGFDFGRDEYDVLQKHVRELSAPRAMHAEKPAWWYEPIFCGWGAQCALASAEDESAADYARQELYDEFLDTLGTHGIDPGIVVLDDKWQATYGENQVDRRKWPDLPAFIARQHRAGRRVLLWLKAWDPEGISVEECICNAAGMPVAVDPTNPMYERRLRSSVRRMLAPDGYDADGFKIDFTARIPSGPQVSTYGDAWGLELMKVYLRTIYEEAKSIKHDALVMTHTPHPYLADVVDVIRLNDINVRADVDVNEAMSRRAHVARIACPDALIDTDNWPARDKATWREFVRLQPDLGVPSLYYVSHIDSTGERLEPEDYRLIREVWARHRANVRSVNGETTSERRAERLYAEFPVYRSRPG